MLAEVARASKEPELKGLTLYFLQNQAKGVTDSLRELGKAGIEGTVLSVLVLFFFLRDWRATAMVSLAIPICFVMTLGCMYFFGISLNILSMMGLLLAVGMLVDNAVVAVESIYQYRERYPDKPWYSAVEGTRAVGTAITAGTLTSIIVFLPNVFGERTPDRHLPDPGGDLDGDRACRLVAGRGQPDSDACGQIAAAEVHRQGERGDATAASLRAPGRLVPAQSRQDHARPACACCC